MSGRISVLAVDDNPDHLHLIERRLRDAGIDAVTATSADQALKRIEGVDIVLLDYRMPGVSGIDVLRRIRSASGPSVIIVTGMGSEDVAVEAMRAGAIDYVVKNPGYLEALPQIVERAWRTHDLSRRAGEVERLALLVTSTTEREELLAEIVRGARRLLRTKGAVLFIDGDEGLELASADGESATDAAGRIADADRLVSAGEGSDIATHDGDLLVRLPSSEGSQLGVLAVITDEGRALLPEEIHLARTFASFAGLALERLRRSELEQALVAELQRMLDLRRSVVASVSHELRTPLTCIEGFSDTLLDHWDRLGDGDRIDFVAKIGRHAHELHRLVEGLLDFAAVEAGRLDADLVNVSLLAEVSSAVDGLEPVLAGRTVEVDVDDVEVVADPRLLRRVLANLLSNAAKYSEGSTPVVIRGVRQGRAIRVEVDDRGIGMSPTEAERAFEPFWRSHSITAQAMRGAGIGLALVKEYVRVMGGHVGVDSEPGVGSTFWFTLPSAGTSAVDRSSAAAETESGRVDRPPAASDPGTETSA